MYFFFSLFSIVSVFLFIIVPVFSGLFFLVYHIVYYSFSFFSSLCSFFNFIVLFFSLL